MFKSIVLVISAILATLFMVGCSGEEEISREKMVLKLQVTSINPPKHFSIKMVDENGRPYGYSSKRCSGYSKYVIGSWYYVHVTEVITKNKEGEHFSYRYLNGIC